jgi:ferritin
MQLISKLSDMIEEELNDSEKYIRCAMNHKEDNPTLAAAFAKLSSEEMGHVNILHEQVVNLINEYRKAHGDPPEKMQGIYDYLHKKHIDRANEIKVMQALFKG